MKAGTTVVTTEATVLEDVSQVTPKQRKFLKSFNVPGYAQHPLSAWSLTVTKLVLTSHLPLWMPFSI